MVGKAHHPSSSESDYWGDESWTVDCPCGVNFDDGEEMVECDECGVWVHTACCRVPKGLSTFVCDKCKIKKKKECEEVAAEVTYVVVESAPSVEGLVTDRLHKSNDVPIAERVHVQGIPGGEPRMFVGVSKVFCQQLWKFTGYVPKALHLKLNDVPSWPYADEMPELLPYTSSGKQVCFVNKEDEKMKERQLDEYGGNLKALNLMAEQFTYKEKHAKRDGKKPEGKHSKHRHKPRALKEERLHLHNKRGREEGSHKDHSSKKRMRSGGETVRSEEELLRGGEGLPLEVGNVTTKCALSSPKNPKAMKKMAVQEFMDGHVSVCSRCNTREQSEAQRHQTPGGKAELFFCHDCEKLQSWSSEDIKVEFRGEFSLPSTICAPEAAIITHSGTGTGSEDLKPAEQKLEGVSLKVDKCKAENEQLCLSKLESVQTATSGKEIQLDKKGVVGEHRYAERERGGNKYEGLKPVGDDDILVNSLEAEKVDGQHKTNAEVGEILEISQVISKVEVSKPAGLDLTIKTPETARETGGGVEVATDEEQSPGSTSVLFDSPKLCTSAGPSLSLANASISPSRKRPRATIWASETTRIASKGALLSGTTVQGSVVSFGQTLAGKIKANDVLKQDDLSLLSDQKFRSGRAAGEHSTAITELASSSRFESLHGLDSPVDASGDCVSAPHMDLVAIRKPSDNDGKPVSAANTVSLEPPPHSPKAQLEVKDDALSFPSSLNLFGAAMENSIEDKPSSSERRGQGSARTSGHLPASVREKMLVDRLSLQQQRSSFSPSSSQAMPSSHQDFLPPGSLQALNRLGAISKSPGSGQVTKRVLEAEGKTTLLRQPITCTEQDPNHETTRVLTHSNLHDLPEQPRVAAQGEAVESNPSSSLPVCQQARQPVGNLAHVVVRSRHMPSSSSASSPKTASTGTRAPGANTAWTMRSVGMTARHSTSPKASSSSHSSPSNSSISPSKPVQGANRSSPSSPPPLRPAPGILSSKTSQFLTSGRPSISASSSSPSLSLAPGALVSQKSGPLLSASSWPVKPPSASNLPSRTSSLPSVLKFTECSTAVTPLSVSGLVNRSGSPGVSLPGVSVKEIMKPSPSPVVTISPGVRPSLQSFVVKHTGPVFKSVTPQSSKSPPIPASLSKQLCGSLTNPCKPTSGSQVIKTTPTASLKPGSISTLQKEEKCSLNPVPAPSKIISTMPPPPALVSLKRAPPAIITNLPASSTTMNDEELALKLHQELNSSPRVPRVPRARQAVTGHQLVSSTQSSIVPPAKRPAGASSISAAGSSLKEHNLVSKKRLRDDRSKDGFRSSSGDESGKSGSNSLFNTATKLRISDNTEDAVSEKDGSGRPSDGACAKDRLDVNKTIDQNEVVAIQSGFPRGSLSIILPQRGDESSDSGDRRSPGDATKAFPGVNDELLSGRGLLSSEDVNEAVIPHWQRLRKVTGECGSQRQDAVDSLPIRTPLGLSPEINIMKSTPSRVQQQMSSTAMIESEDEEDGGVFSPHVYHGSKESMTEEKGSDPEERTTDFVTSRKDKLQLLEEVPKGKRKARRGRRLAVHGHDGQTSGGGHKAEKCAGETEEEEDGCSAGQEDELDVPSSPSSEDAVSNYSEEDEEMVVHRGIRSRGQCGEGESSAGEDDEGD